jgi:hypothetical protein
VFTVKQGLFTSILLSIFALGQSFAHADYQINVATSRAASDVPVGDLVVKVGGIHSLNTSGVIGNFGLSVKANSTLEVVVEPRSIFLVVQKGSTIEGSDLTVNSVFTPQTQIQSYQRQKVGFGVVSNSANESFTADANYNLSVSFELAPLSSAQQYQYYFDTDTLPGLVDGKAPLNNGRFYSSSPTDPIPWSVISFLGTGNNLYATVRVVDFAQRSFDIGFEFDVTPMGGGAAVPEPSTWWMIGLLASSYAGRQGWKRWRKRK